MGKPKLKEGRQSRSAGRSHSRTSSARARCRVARAALPVRCSAQPRRASRLWQKSCRRLSLSSVSPSGTFKRVPFFLTFPRATLGTMNRSQLDEHAKVCNSFPFHCQEAEEVRGPRPWHPGCRRSNRQGPRTPAGAERLRFEIPPVLRRDMRAAGGAQSSDRHDPKSRLACPNHSLSLSGPILGCIDAPIARLR